MTHEEFRRTTTEIARAAKKLSPTHFTFCGWVEKANPEAYFAFRAPPDESTTRWVDIPGRHRTFRTKVMTCPSGIACTITETNGTLSVRIKKWARKDSSPVDRIEQVILAETYRLSGKNPVQIERYAV